MDAAAVSRAVAEAAALLCSEHGFSGQAMLYYQTDALLGFHPQELACCVTHHGPFVHDFVGMFSARETARAFGDAAKALHLFKHQELGVNRVRSNGRMFVLQHSQLQREYLVSRGVDERRIHAVRPPIAPSTAPEPLRDDRLGSFVEEAELLVFTAVARLDYFKNVELLVSGCVQARKRGDSFRSRTGSCPAATAWPTRSSSCTPSRRVSGNSAKNCGRASRPRSPRRTSHVTRSAPGPTSHESPARRAGDEAETHR
ncbi:hypothetical protein [Streptomyces chrestomyceticus]|uniref:Uncharacterized protein n=1 Tax=Streptomyces chrestomyceticus TaxID=68185 RepID=A0ABU7WQ65_9ACTN